jgi:hypothetical protein
VRCKQTDSPRTGSVRPSNSVAGASYHCPPRARSASGSHTIHSRLGHLPLPRTTIVKPQPSPFLPSPETPTSVATCQRTYLPPTFLCALGADRGGRTMCAVIHLAAPCVCPSRHCHLRRWRPWGGCLLRL